MELTSKAVVLGTSLSSLVVGSVAGYFVAKKRLSKKFEALAQEEIAKARQHYKMFYKKDEFDSTPEALAQKALGMNTEEVPLFHEAVDALLKYDPEENFVQTPLTPDPPVPVQESRNIFEGPQMAAIRTMNYDEELPKRDPHRPYVISLAEYGANETHFNQVTLSYYADGALTEEDSDDMILDIDQFVGSWNLEQFGYGSDDPDIVYVRNNKLRIDYEIIRDHRHFGRDIQGWGEEVVHKMAELRKPVGERVSPRARFNNYKPGGIPTL